MAKQTPNWQTWWLVIGPKLPERETRLLPNVIIAPLSDENFELEKNGSVPVPKITGGPDFVIAHYPPSDVVRSRHRLQVDVRAKDQDEAESLVRDIVDRILLGFTLTVPGARYVAELRHLRQAGVPGQVSAWSQTVGIEVRDPPNFATQDEIADALVVFSSAGSNSTVESSYVHLMTAWQLQDVVGSKPLKRSILQHYILSIEAIVNGIMTNVRGKDSARIRAEEHKYVDELILDLPRRADKPKAIREASTRLREIGLQNMLPSIEMVAPLLGLSTDQASAAKKLYQLRSSTLSHPGKKQGSEIDAWITPGENFVPCKADELARAFLSAYCHTLNRK